jgi:hypothetical protein
MRLGSLALGAGLAFAVAEIAVRLTVDFARQAPIAVRGVDPERPIAFLPGHSAIYESDEFRYETVFNRFGRRDVEWSDAAIASPDGILFIGDSFTLGNGLHHEQAIPTLLEGLLDSPAGRPEVFNFGMPGGGPPQYAMLLDSALDDGFGARTVVVMLFVGNDFYPDVLDDPRFDVEQRRRHIAELARAPEPLFRSQLVRFARLRVSQSTALVSALLSAGKLVGRSLYWSPTAYIFQRELMPAQRAVMDSILDFVRAMKRRCDEAGRDLHLILMPNRVQVENAAALTSATMDPTAPGRRVEKLCAEIEVPCIDLLPILRGEYERSGTALYYPIDRHLNPLGAEIAANAIAVFLNETRAWKSSN